MAKPVDTPPVSSPNPIGVLLVGSPVMFVEGLAALLGREPDITLGDPAAAIPDALAALAKTNPAVLLLDADSGPELAVDFIRAARHSGFAGAILILATALTDSDAVQLVQSGIAGILHKNHPVSKLCATIREVAAGKVCLEPAYLAPLFRSLDKTKAARRPMLTERDRAVVRKVLQGLTNREIAAGLEISEGAVKASLRHVCEKLGVRTRSQLVKVALEQYRDQL